MELSANGKDPANKEPANKENPANEGNEVRRAPGHRLAPHTADCVIEAWGPDRISCLVEALKALVEVFAEPTDTPATLTLPVLTNEASDSQVLVGLLEEVIYVLDVFAVVPVRFDLAETEGGGVAGNIGVVPADQVEAVGPVPKAVSYHGLQIDNEGGTWRCRVVVDV
jgi:SHS2 domain-containing protein